MIYNASAYEAVEDKRVRDFLQFIMTNDPAGNDFNKLLSDTVERLKENDKFRSDYAAMNLHDRDIIRKTQKEAIALGQQQNAIESAKKMLTKKYPVNEISEITGLPIEQVIKLAKEI